MNPKWEIGQRFRHRDTGIEFEITEYQIFPERVLYKLIPINDLEAFPLLRFEAELEWQGFTEISK